jgi:6-phosphogluconolactonase
VSLPPPSDVRVAADRAGLEREGEACVRSLVAAAVAARGRCRLALAGGSTPRGIYQRLAADGEPAIDWARVELFFGDERHVPPDHAESNYRMVRESLLARLAGPPPAVHRMRGEEPDAEVAARAYGDALRSGFGLSAGELPRFDVMLLGMGPDGHTASLFPHTPALRVDDRLAVAVPPAAARRARITLTFPVINASRQVVVLAGGADKAEALRAALAGPLDVETYPIQGVRPVEGTLTWIVDRSAAAEMR